MIHYQLMTMSKDISDILSEFEDYLNINTSSSLTTKKKYKSIVRRFLLSGDLGFTLKDVNNFIANNKGRNNYINKYALKHFLDSLGRKDWSEQLIKPKRFKRKKVFKYVNKDTVEKIINGLQPKHKPIALIQYKTGVRFSEAITIRAESIDFDISDNFIVIQLGKNKSLTKGSKERSVYLHKKYGNYLRNLIKRPWGYVFLPEESENTPAEKLLNKLTVINNEYNEDLRKIGAYYHIEGLSSHYLRHLFSDNFLKIGGDPVYLQKALGHSDIRTTLSYVSIQDKLVEDTLLKMEG